MKATNHATQSNRDVSRRRFVTTLAAAVAANARITPSQVPLQELREVLKQHGVIVPNA